MAVTAGNEVASGRAVVVGLGYVGLPLAVALAEHIETIGLDIDPERISELGSGHDRTREIEAARLGASPLKLAGHPADCPPADFYIVTVPTPIDARNRPDLSLVEAASTMVGGMLPMASRAGRKPIVIYESTVYPGVTEERCAPILATASGLECGRDFFLGYSPERINPGDGDHRVEQITKVVSAQSAAVLDRVAALYAMVTAGGVFRARSIRVAEAAKVIENAQRDINIAFMNEIAQICARMDLSVWDVLAAARTKWNFLPFSPGLVGGHCIGVDPYYLAHRAVELGVEPRVILSGRSINDAMAPWLADRLHEQRKGVPGSVLVLGLTFKQDIPDLRNSKVADLIASLAALGHRVTVHDPCADPGEAAREYGIPLRRDAPAGRHDLVVLAVPHRYYRELGVARLRDLVATGGTLADPGNALDGAADWTL